MLLVALLLSTSAGCLAPAGSSVNRDASSRGKITITLWTQDKWMGITGHEMDNMSPDDPRRAKYTYTDWYVKTFNEYRAKHPDVDLEFEIETLDWSPTGFQKLDIAVVSGHPPDIMISTSATTLKYARYGLLEPLDDSLTEDDRRDFGDFLSLSEVDGHYYFMPFIGGNRYIVCNLKVFKERNALHWLPGMPGGPIPDRERPTTSRPGPSRKPKRSGDPDASGLQRTSNPDRHWNWDQFIRAATAVTFTRVNGERVWGYAMPFQRSSPMLEQGPFFWGFGARFFDESGNRVIANSLEGVRGLQFIVDMEHKYKVMPPGAAGLRGNDIDDLWNAGRLAMRLGSHGTKLVTERAVKQGLIKPGTLEIYPVMFPHEPGHRPGTFVVADSPCIFKQRDPLKKKLTIEFVKFMTDTRHEREVAYALSTLPTRKSAADVWKNDPYQNYVLRVTQYGLKDAIQAYGVPLRDMTNFAMQAALSGQRTPKEALDEFAQRANRFIEREERRRRASRDGT